MFQYKPLTENILANHISKLVFLEQALKFKLNFYFEGGKMRGFKGFEEGNLMYFLNFWEG